MKLKSILGRIVSAASAAAMVVAGFSVIPANDNISIDTNAAGAVVIDTTKEYQTIRGFGGIDHPEWTGSALSASQRQTAFGNGANEMGLTVLRVFVNPDKNQWNKAVGTAKFVSDLGYTVFASPWEPPSNLAESGGSNGKLHIPKSNYAAYAKHLNDFGTYMKENSVNLYSISVQNEPDYASEWTYWSTDETTDFIANYGDQITSTRLMSPESFQYAPENASWVKDGGKKFYTKIMNNAKAMANCDVFGTHMYGTTRDWMDFPALENSGKEIWMTEVYVPNSEADSANRWPEALQVSENIHNAMVVGNMSVYTWWYIRRSYGLMTEDGKISKRGYNMSQYSKWVRPGAKRIDATEQPADNVLVSAYKNDKQITVVAINKGNTEITQAFNIGSGEKIVDVDRYRTSAGENLAKTEDMANDGSGFFSQLPANSVSTFVISLEGSTGNSGNTNPTNPPANTPDENGYYFHDTFENGNDDWEAHGTAELTMSGRIPCKDTNALLVQGREKSWNGVQKTLGSGFKGGQEYSFSVCATYVDGSETQTMKLSLQYTDTAGDTKFANIATGVTAKNQYVQLVNKNFKLPEGSDYVIYVETADGSDNFYIDEAIAAVGGTEIAVHHSPVLPEPTTAPPTKEPVIPAGDFIAGDVNLDGRVDAFDLAAMRKGVLTSFANATAKAAADVNNDGENNIADLVLLSEYLLGQDARLQKSESLQGTTPPDAPAAKMRTISEYTPIVAANISEYETDDSKTEKPGVNYGTLEKKSYYSNFCGRNKKYNVLLPANYDESKKYPVLYVMHGYWEDQDRMILTGNDHIPTQQIIGNAIAEGAAKEMIVVFPYIYSSQTQDNCSAMDDANNQAYDNFDTVLTTELMPLIESEYSVATGRENTAITGFSMGGREALMIGQKHPDLFGYMGAICAAPGATGAFKFASEEEAPSLILLTAGSNDQTVYTTPEGYHNNFTTNGVPHIWHYVNGGYHGDNCIRAHIYNFIRAIFKA